MRHVCPETTQPCEEGCDAGPCAFQMGTRPYPGSREAAAEEVRKAWREFVLEVVRVTHLDKLLDWLEARLG